jgi:hypothetical protein
MKKKSTFTDKQAWFADKIYADILMMPSVMLIHSEMAHDISRNSLSTDTLRILRHASDDLLRVFNLSRRFQ